MRNTSYSDVTLVTLEVLDQVSLRSQFPIRLLCVTLPVIVIRCLAGTGTCCAYKSVTDGVL